MQTDQCLTVLDANIDWLTVTAKRGPDADSLHTIAHALLHRSMGDGNFLSTFRSMGYKGERTGGVSYGRRYDGSILTLTSGEAARSAAPLLGGEYHVTRLDLQITCADSTCNASRAEIAYHLMHENRKRAGRPVSASLRLNSSGGQTLYLGSKHSDVIARLYDKGIEAKAAPAGACWRFETQYRREPAGRTASAIHQSQAYYDTIATLVTSHFSYRGVVVPQVEGNPACDKLQHQSLYSKRDETDHERSLRWLSTFVAPSVRKLIDCGKRDLVLAALGLDGEE